MKYNVYILFIIILCSTFFTQANVIYSGTRFIYNEDDNDIIINIKNKRLGVILRSKPLFYLKIEL